LIFGGRKPVGPPPSDAKSAPGPAQVATRAPVPSNAEVDGHVVDESGRGDLGPLGPRFDRHSPFYIGFFGGLGFVLAGWLFGQFERIGGVLILIFVSLFLAAGLNPSVEWFQRRGMRRSFAVTMVIVLFLLGDALF
jgi:hypothetical protein